MYQLVTSQLKLHEKSYAVPYDTYIPDITNGMIEFMKENNARGLAAPQIGIFMNIFVIRDMHDKYRVYVNPDITDIRKRGWFAEEEECISFPGERVIVARPGTIKILAMDEDWRHHKEKLIGIMARCVCHEMDHLRGRIVLDYRDTLFGMYGRHVEFFDLPR